MNVIPLDGREYPPEAVWQAQERFCVLRQTYAQIAEEMGIAASTLKRWGAQHDWRDKREAYARAQAEMRGDMIMARSQMLKELIASGNPLLGFAVAKLEEVALKQAQAEREGRLLEIKAARQRRAINSPAEAAEALKEAVELKLARMLASPEEVDLKTVKDIKEALALIAAMQPQDKGQAGPGQGLTADQVDTIRNRILGDG